MMTEFLNEKPFEHTCRWGTTFSGSRCDFQDGVKVTFPTYTVNQMQNASDFAEFAAWHALQIWPHLNGFSGYDNILFQFQNVRKEK